MDASVQAVYNSYLDPYYSTLLELRSLIYEVANNIPEVDQVEESIKWGQPSYTSKIGTPIRLAHFEDDKIAILFHCQTTMIEDLRRLFGDTLKFSKNRAILLSPTDPLPIDELKICIELALTYHHNKT